MTMLNLTNLPLATPGLTSYRYRGEYGFVMIGAINYSDAKRQAELSIRGPVNPFRLEIWIGDKYVSANH
jgi:multisubunit Na+/H+ antiporter MnhE subunit